MKQTIVWTVLPHGSTGPLAAGTTLNRSIFIAPRLWDADPTITRRQLADYPDFLDWPATVGAATFEIDFGGGVKLPATPAATSKPLDSDLWKALFKNDTLVIPFRFENRTGDRVKSFPSLTIHDTIKSIYLEAATNPRYGDGESLPHRDVLSKNPDLTEIAVPFDPPPPYKPVPVDEHPVVVGTPGPEKDVPGKPGTPSPTPAGCVKFGCQGCIGIPLTLLRRFLKWIGLLATLPFTMGIGGAAFDRLDSFVAPTSPKSEPLPKPEDLKDIYDFHQMVSSLGDYPALMRSLGLVLDLEVTLGAALPAATGTVTVTPAIPLTMATTNYSPRTRYELAANRFLAQSSPAGDLRDGLLRVDDTNRFSVLQLDVPGSGIKVRMAATKLVHDDTHGSWPGNEDEEQGLPALQAAGLSIVRPNMEAYVKDRFLDAWAMNQALAAKDGSPTTPANTPTPPAPKEDLFAEDLVRGYRVDVLDDKSNAWHSLCQRIGTYKIAGIPDFSEPDEATVQMSVTEPLKKTDPRELRLHESLFSWNGWSLGAPRYGNLITAGDSPNPDDPSQVTAPSNPPVTPFKMEVHFEPKPKSLPRLRFGYSYRLRVRSVDLAGNSVFDPDETPGTPFQTTQAEVTPEVRYRRFEPISPPMLILQNKVIEGESLERLVVRSKFDDPVAFIEAQGTTRHVVPPKTSQQMAELHRKFDRAPGMASSNTAYDLAAREAGSLVEDADKNKIGNPEEITEDGQKYWIQKDDTFDIAYLPDPYARGVLLKGLPGGAADGEQIEFVGAWPDPKPFRIRMTGIAAGAVPDPPNWNPATLLLSIQIPQGETHEVRINSFLEDPDFDNMAVWNWIEEKGLADLVTRRARAAGGLHWLHMPYRKLILIHAVQQPLKIPKVTFTVPVGKKKLGDTIAILEGAFDADAKSTGRIDLHATWTDPIDDLSKTTYSGETIDQNMHVAEVRVTDPKNDNVAFPPNLQHVVGDTKYHHVTYRPIASTRYREYFPETITAKRENLIRPTPDEAAIPTDLDIPNSTRPDRPKPLYIVPLFEWKRSATGLNAVRRGAGLRVYMERPWFSSGAGELLGMTLRPASVNVPSAQYEALRKNISEWGRDPLWPAAATSPLSEFNFFAFDNLRRDVILAEDGRLVDVLGYAPKFDPERNLWACDIRLQPGTAFFPMVKLALVRFQPVSVDGAHISAVVPADIVQIVPDREVTYDISNVDTTGVVEVEVSGPTYIDANNNPSHMMVALEERDPIGTDNEIGWKRIRAQRLTAGAGDRDKMTWRGQVRLAPGPRPKPLRVVVMEFDMYVSDDDRPHADTTNALEGIDLPSQGYRITFADTLEVP